jgi:hypothetical protein
MLCTPCSRHRMGEGVSRAWARRCPGVPGARGGAGRFRPVRRRDTAAPRRLPRLVHNMRCIVQAMGGLLLWWWWWWGGGGSVHVLSGAAALWARIARLCPCFKERGLRAVHDPSAAVSSVPRPGTRGPSFCCISCACAHAALVRAPARAGFIIPELHGVSSHMQGIVSASVFVGMLIGGVVAGLAADRFGRKPFL